MQWFLIFLLSASTAMPRQAARGQNDSPPNWNIPRGVWDRFRADQLPDHYEISTKLNPFYLRGDFDGDGIPDYAVLLTNRITNATGIAVVRSGARHVEVLGAGGIKLHVAALPDGSPSYWFDDFGGCDAWHVVRKQRLRPTGWDKPITPMIGEGIEVETAEASAALIYWDGKQYRWLQDSN